MNDANGPTMLSSFLGPVTPERYELSVLSYVFVNPKLILL